MVRHMYNPVEHFTRQPLLPSWLLLFFSRVAIYIIKKMLFLKNILPGDTGVRQSK
jgi:hypothetical protein